MAWLNKDEAAPATAAVARGMQEAVWKRVRPTFRERLGAAAKALRNGPETFPTAQANVPGGANAPSFGSRIRDAVSYVMRGDPRTFFPPGTGLAPQAPAEAKARRFDYPTYFNAQIPPRAYESLSFSVLRGLADSHDLTRLVLETAKARIATQGWDIISIEDNDPPDKGNLTKALEARGKKPRRKVGAGTQDRIDALKNFFRCPDGRRSFAQWSRMLLEDLFVLDAMTLYIERSVSGDVYALKPIDGGTIAVKLDYWGDTPAPPDAAYQQVIKGVPAINYSAAGTEDNASQDGPLVREYTDGELLYMPYNLRTHKAYGNSVIEQVLVTINIAIRRQLYQLEYYRSASIPNYIIETPSDWTPNQIESAQEWFTAQFADSMASRWRALLLPNGCKPMSEKQVQLKDEMDDYLTKMLCYAFSVDPSQLGKATSRASSQHAGDQSDKEGFQPFSNFFAEQMDRLIQGPFGFDDCQFVFQWHHDPNTLMNSQMYDLYINDGVMTRNEVREQLGLEPMDGGDDAGPPPPPIDPNAIPPGMGGTMKPPFGGGGPKPAQPPKGKAPQAKPQSAKPTATGASAKRPARPAPKPANSSAKKPVKPPARNKLVNDRPVGKSASNDATEKASATMAHARAHLKLKRLRNAEGTGADVSWKPKPPRRKRPRPMQRGLTVTPAYKDPKPKQVKALSAVLHEGLQDRASAVVHAVTQARRAQVHKATEDDAAKIDLLSEDEIRRLIRQSLTSGWQAYTDDLQTILEEAANDGALDLIGHTGMSLSSTQWDEIDKSVQRIATERAGSLVGMRYDATADDWLPNPDAEWSITEDVRDGLFNLITTAEQDDWSNTDLAKAIQDSTTFSKERSELIAATELKNIEGEANREAATTAGADKKCFLLSADEGVCDECQENGDAGWIDIDDAFPSGDDDVPVHPGCRCVCSFRWPDDIPAEGVADDAGEGRGDE